MGLLHIKHQDSMNNSWLVSVPITHCSPCGTMWKSGNMDEGIWEIFPLKRCQDLHDLADWIKTMWRRWLLLVTKVSFKLNVCVSAWKIQPCIRIWGCTWRNVLSRSDCVTWIWDTRFKFQLLIPGIYFDMCWTTLVTAPFNKLYTKLYLHNTFLLHKK